MLELTTSIWFQLFVDPFFVKHRILSRESCFFLSKWHLDFRMLMQFLSKVTTLSNQFSVSGRYTEGLLCKFVVLHELHMKITIVIHFSTSSNNQSETPMYLIEAIPGFGELILDWLVFSKTKGSPAPGALGRGTFRPLLKTSQLQNASPQNQV